jgi:hypothetical protein
LSSFISSFKTEYFCLVSDISSSYLLLHSSSFMGVFGSRFWVNQAHGVQASGVWLPAPPPEPGSPDAISLLLPASSETPETVVYAESGSAHAVVSLTNDVLVYN